jgi:glycosyltransferase involved in cell wall biosynthesis
VPAVTVGLAVFNGERYLAEALDTWLSQDFEDFELVVSDNASTDRTPEILRDYARGDARIRLVRRDRTVLAWQNYNGLVAEARAPLFAWSACDDLRNPSYLRVLVDALAREKDAVLAYGRAVFFGEARRMHRHLESDRRPGCEATPLARGIALLRARGWAPLYGVIRTELLQRTRLFVHPMGLPADTGLALELAMHGRFVYCPDALLSIRLHAGSLSSTPSEEINRGRRGRRLDPEALEFFEGLPKLDPVSRRLLLRELTVFCRKAQKPRRFLWRIPAFRSAYVHASRALVDLSRAVRRL